MASIRVLPDELIGKIQAGEVVERPSSVVKELIENSIDAGSKRIDVEVKGAGKRLIRVSDDGYGMQREDALLSLQRHTTSKITNEEGLFDIKTMGFRGEALPSIASVSRLLLITAPKGMKYGVSIETEGSRIINVKDIATVGTTVEARDLFFNTPPRRKFLKTDRTELIHIVETLTRLSLSHPHIGFSLKADDLDMMDIPNASTLKERLMQVYGAEFLDGLIEINSGDVPSFRAFMSKKDNLRETRSHQYIFINRRPVREQSITHAVYSSYDQTGRHPIFFVFLEIKPSMVDFNVHPTKQEVRFSDKDLIYRLIKEGIMEKLYLKTESTQKPAETSVSFSGTSFSEEGLSGVYRIEEALSLRYNIDLPFIYLGDSFVAFSDEAGGITLIDVHAAHERILYEKLLKGVNLESVEMLFPSQVKLSTKEYMVILKHMEILRDFGIVVEDFGHESLLIRSLPLALSQADLRGILSDISSVISQAETGYETSGMLWSLKDAVSASIACHNSIRGKRLLEQDELRALLRDLNDTEHPDACPHGRPTRVSYSLDDLKKLFKRK